ncbi:MAG: HPr family phosphocarrier protein [Stomatobaculum sp.]|nr:HPr family phosphocarrier protein [Stomatobaculum sp.]
MVSQKVKVINPSGLHLRPAGNLCKEAIRYESKVELLFRDSEANAKSVLSVLGACVKCGDEIEFRCTGPDEAEALEAVISLAKNGFGEEE